MIIYHYQKNSFARGHRRGAVRYFDGAHLSKKSPPGAGGVLPFILLKLASIGISTTAMRPDAIEAIQKPVEMGGCAFWPCILAQSPLPIKMVVALHGRHRNRVVKFLNRVVKAGLEALTNDDDSLRSRESGVHFET